MFFPDRVGSLQKQSFWVDVKFIMWSDQYQVVFEWWLTEWAHLVAHSVSKIKAYIPRTVQSISAPCKWFCKQLWALHRKVGSLQKIRFWTELFDLMWLIPGRFWLVADCEWAHLVARKQWANNYPLIAGCQASGRIIQEQLLLAILYLTLSCPANGGGNVAFH